MTRLVVNGRSCEVPADPDCPLLYALRNDLGLNGAKFGCGLGQCGACTVLADGVPLRSCATPLGAVAGGAQAIETIEGLSPDGSHPLQRAFVAEQAAQCGYCTAGMVMQAAGLLRVNPRPTEAEVRRWFDMNLCRCGTHNRVVRAVLRAAREMAA